jgi:hypothetical protein
VGFLCVRKDMGSERGGWDGVCMVRAGLMDLKRVLLFLVAETGWITEVCVGALRTLSELLDAVKDVDGCLSFTFVLDTTALKKLH